MPASEELTLARPARWAARALAALIPLGLLIVPLACAPKLIDRFRIVKEAVLRGEALIGLLFVIAIIAFSGWSRVRELVANRALFAIAIGGIAWAAISTLASTHRLLSVESFTGIALALALFLVTWFIAPRVGLVALDLLVPVAAINATLAALQEWTIWNPFEVHPDTPTHLTATALIGNPNIVGSYLALVAVILTTAATSTRGLRRYWYILGALFAIGGVLISDTETAVLSLAAGLGLLAIGGSWRRAVGVAVALIAIFCIAWAMHVPVIMDLLALPQRIRTQGLETALSGRVAPALVALRLTREHPITGTGPGTYGFHFMPTRITLATESNGAIGLGFGMNFGEVHNDHLQVLAESGVIGYLLFLAAIAIVVLAAVRSRDVADPRWRFARRLAIPLAGAFFVLCLAQFPLQVAVTRHLILTMAALIAGWSRT